MATPDQKRELLESIEALNPYQQARLPDCVRNLSQPREGLAYND